MNRNCTFYSRDCLGRRFLVRLHSKPASQPSSCQSAAASQEPPSSARFIGSKIVYNDSFYLAFSEEVAGRSKSALRGCAFSIERIVFRSREKQRAAEADEVDELEDQIDYELLLQKTFFVHTCCIERNPFGRLLLRESERELFTVIVA